MERIADRILRTMAPWIITLMGVIVVGAGALAVGASTEPGALGADVSLLLGGLGVAFLGLLMVLRVRHDLVRTGLAAVTTGFFAVQLAAFEAGTRRCDINPALADCGGIVVDQQPYAIFGAPMLLAAILLIYLVFEPFARRRDGTDATAVAVAGAAPVTAVAASTPQPPGGTASADPLSHEMSATTLAATVIPPDSRPPRRPAGRPTGHPVAALTRDPASVAAAAGLAVAGAVVGAVLAALRLRR
jgi:hypothetical protein